MCSSNILKTLQVVSRIAIIEDRGNSKGSSNNPDRRMKMGLTTTLAAPHHYITTVTTITMRFPCRSSRFTFAGRIPATRNHLNLSFPVRMASFDSVSCHIQVALFHFTGISSSLVSKSHLWCIIKGLLVENGSALKAVPPSLCSVRPWFRQAGGLLRSPLFRSGY